MKTYLFDTFNRYKRFSEKLDAKTILCNKSWWVFNDSGEKEVYIFNTDGSLIVSIKGKVSYSTWKYIPANKSIIITAGEESYMVIPAFVDSNILALQIDGTDEFAFLIDEQNIQKFLLKTLLEVEKYFEAKEAKEIEAKIIQAKEQQESSEGNDISIWTSIIVVIGVFTGLLFFLLLFEKLVLS